MRQLLVGGLAIPPMIPIQHMEILSVRLKLLSSRLGGTLALFRLQK